MAAASSGRRPRVARVDDACGELLERVRRAIVHAQSIPVVAAEELSGDDLLPTRHDVILSLDSTSVLLADVLAHYDRDADDGELDFELGDAPSAMCGEVERRMDAESGPGRITSVAFVARIGLRNRRASLQALGAEPKWELIASCSSAVREILKALSAVEVAIAEHEGAAPTSRYYATELEHALEVRRAYFTFRAEILAGGPPALSDAARRLRSAGSALAKLTGRPAYRYARVHDRASLRNLQARIRQQLTAHARADGSDFASRAALDVAAARLHQDLTNLAELMMLINNRAELREHDGAKLARAIEIAEADGGAAAVEYVRALLGRDPELDEIVLGGPAAIRDVIAVFRRCREAVARADNGDRTDAPSGQRRATDAPAAAQTQRSGAR